MYIRSKPLHDTLPLSYLYAKFPSWFLAPVICLNDYLQRAMEMVYPANVLGIQGVRGSSPHISTQIPGLLDRRPRCYYPFGTRARGNPAMWARTSPATRQSMPLCVIFGDGTVCGETGHPVLATFVLESFLEMMSPRRPLICCGAVWAI